MHRDIKSANLFLAKRGGASDEIITKVLDFGIAKVRASPLAPLEDNKLTTTGSMLGSPVYGDLLAARAAGAGARADRFPSAEAFREALVALLVRGDTTLRSDMLVPMTERETLQVATRAAVEPSSRGVRDGDGRARGGDDVGDRRPSRPPPGACPGDDRSLAGAGAAATRHGIGADPRARAQRGADGAAGGSGRGLAAALRSSGAPR